MVNIGIIGIGFMGVTHYKALQKVSGARVAAICTRSEKKLAGDWRDIKGNFGDSGGVQDLSGIAKYKEIDQLLADPAVDLVDICLPTHEHRGVTIRALQAGKHVICEKPIAVNMKDADAMIAAAKKAKRHLFIGQVLRFFPEFAYVNDAIADKRYGKLIAAHFKRVISMPDWQNGSWLNQSKAGGGPLIDLHIHDADFIVHALGLPKRVASHGTVARGGVVTYVVTEYFYGKKGPVITAQSGAIAAKGLLFEHGFDVYFEHGTLQHNSKVGQPLTLWKEDGGSEKIDLSGYKDGFVAELGHAADVVAGRAKKNLLSAISVRDGLRLCLAEGQSVRLGKAVSL